MNSTTSSTTRLNRPPKMAAMIRKVPEESLPPKLLMIRVGRYEARIAELWAISIRAPANLAFSL
ncbi:hypothetical protein D3C87_2191800 [compost metagenome]